MPLLTKTFKAALRAYNTEVHLWYDQIFHISINEKQSRPLSDSSHESRLIWIRFVYKDQNIFEAAARAYCTSSTCV